MLRAAYTEAGCYGDDGTRKLPTFLADVSGPRSCFQTALAGGYSVWGLQIGSQCFAGSDYARATSLGPSPGCLQACTNGDLCGGAWENRVLELCKWVPMRPKAGRGTS